MVFAPPPAGESRSTVRFRLLRPRAFLNGNVAVADYIRFRITLAFDGTNYDGWQVQKTGLGVQQKLEEALARLFPGKPRVHGSSRTDTGVHALGMVAHFDVPAADCRMESQKLLLAVNAWLPEDIRVLSAKRARPDFHARFSAVGKQYRYFVWNHPAMNPLLRDRAWHVKKHLDVPSMRAAADAFLGKHDFRSFRSNPDYDTDSTVRTITRCEINQKGPLLTFVIEADGFLYKMCRGIVGTLVQIGEGRIAARDLGRIIEMKDRRTAGMTAPAHGLVLWKVFYETKTPNASPGSA
jgi:tRNA pseudouridine38-40 synthase